VNSKILMLLLVFLLIENCSNPMSDNNLIDKNDIAGNWAPFMTIANVGIKPIWDESSRTWIGDDTIKYCDTCINTIYIFNENEFSVFLSHNERFSYKHSLFISKYELINQTILSGIDTFKIISKQDNVIHLVKNNTYLFLKKIEGDIPPFFWPDWPTDTIRIE